jgi:multiple sugar transport system substrate-binding protein
MKKRIVFGLVLIVLITGLLTGCSTRSQTNQDSGSSASASAQVKSDEPVTTLTFWRRGNDPVMHQYWLDAIKQFEAANPNIKIDFSDASYDDYDVKLNAAYASGAAPDVITHAISTIGERTAKGQFAPLDTYYNSWDGKGDMIQNLVDIGTYKGNLYGIPFNPTSTVLVYRKDYAQEAGLNPDQPPTNWAEFATWAEKLTQRDGNIVTRSGFVIPQDDSNMPYVFAAMLGDKKSLDPTDPSFDTPEMRKALTYLADLYQNKKVSVETTYSNEKKSTQFANGKAAMQYLTPADLAQMTAADPSIKDKIGFIYLKENQAAYWSGLQFFFISSDSKKKDAAWKFIEFMSSSDQVWARYKQAQIPVVRQSLVQKAEEDDKWLSPAVANSIQNGVASPKVTWSSIYLSKYTGSYFQEVLLGQKTPDEALKENWAALQQEIASTK